MQEPAPIAAPGSAAPSAILAAIPGRSPRPEDAVPGGSPFADSTEMLGIRHRHASLEIDARLAPLAPIISTSGAPVALADVDGDGDIDIYATSSRRGRPNALYLNGGEERAPPLSPFEEAEEAAVRDLNDEGGVTADARFGDLDGDGDEDLYVVRWGSDRLLRNEGGGRFADATAGSGIEERGNGSSALFLDSDSDGDLDIFLAGGLPSGDLTRDGGERFLPDSPERPNGGSSLLYTNEGGLRFRESAIPAGLADSGWSAGAAASDIDADGDADIFVARDFGPDSLYLNAGAGYFVDIAPEALGPDDRRAAGVDAGDFDGDGLPDILVSNRTAPGRPKEGGVLWANRGDRAFSDITRIADLAGIRGSCARFLDFDLDGALDILAVGPGPARLFRNEGDGSFSEMPAGGGIGAIRDGCGIALADLDGDGDIDAVISSRDGPLRACTNRTDGAGRWVGVRLRGKRSNRDGVGARVEVLAAGRLAAREVGGSGGSDIALRFGLGARDGVDRMTISWPSGIVQSLESLKAGHRYTIEEAGEAPRGGAGATSTGTGRAAIAKAGGGESPGLRLIALECALEERPRDVGLGNAYRALATALGRHDRAIEFFRRLVARRQGGEAPPILRLQLALAHIDKVPSVQKDVLLGASVAKDCLLELDRILRERPDCYAAHFIAGMNHLYWPAGLKHAPDALRHLERCRELARADAVRPAVPVLRRLEPAHRLEVVLGIGDARAKAEDLAAAKATWETARAEFGDDPRLIARLSLGPKEVAELVRAERGLDRRIDSGLAILDDESALGPLEERLRREPGVREVFDAYRRDAVEAGARERAEEFLGRLAAEAPGSPEPVLGIALLRARRLGEAGEEGRRAGAEVLGLIRSFRERRPDDFLGRFLEAAIGIRLALDSREIDGKRSGAAEETSAALEACRRAAGLSVRPDGSPRIEAPLIAEGDLLALLGKTEEARAAWSRCRELFPRSREARMRLDAPAAAIPAIVRIRTGLDPEEIAGLARRLEVEAEVDAIESALEKDFRRETCDRYRGLVGKGLDPGRGALFLRRLRESRPGSPAVAIASILALLDRLPDPSIGWASRAGAIREALDLLESLRKSFPRSWALGALRGEVILQSPEETGGIGEAIRALEKAVAAIEAAAVPSPPADGLPGEAAVRARAYAALGDSLVRSRRFIEGRKAWTRGLERFPGDPGLEERMGLTSIMVDGYIERERSWERPLPTGAYSRAIGDLTRIPTE